MTATIEQPAAPAENGAPLVRFDPNEAAIAELKHAYAHLPAMATNREGRDECHKALMVVARHRTTLDKRRKQLTADALKWQRDINGKAKQLENLLLEVETPLRTARDAWDAEQERIKRAAEDAERSRLAAIEKEKRDAEEVERKRQWAAKEAELLAQRQADEEKARAERARLADLQAKIDAERKANEAAQAAAQAKLDKQRKEDDDRRVAERRRLDAEAAAQAEANRKAQWKIDADRRAVQAEKDTLEHNRLAAEIRERVARETQERLDRECREENERKEREAAAAEAERQRLEALKPDAEKIHAWGQMLLAIDLPPMTTDEGAAFMLDAKGDLDDLARACGKFGEGA